MSQSPLCPNLTKKVQKEVSQIANRNLSLVILLGGLSVNLNHLKTAKLNLQNFRVPSPWKLGISGIWKEFPVKMNNYSTVRILQVRLASHQLQDLL